MLGIARALAVKPKMLLLDRPLGGMNPEEIDFTKKSHPKAPSVRGNDFAGGTQHEDHGFV